MEWLLRRQRLVLTSGRRWHRQPGQGVNESQVCNLTDDIITYYYISRFKLLGRVDDALDNGLAVLAMAVLGNTEGLLGILESIAVSNEGLEVDEATGDEGDREGVVALTVAERAEHLQLLGDNCEHGDRDSAGTHANLNEATSGSQELKTGADADGGTGSINADLKSVEANLGNVESLTEGGRVARLVRLQVLTLLLGRLGSASHLEYTDSQEGKCR